ncbi:MAG: imidazole glycerol phosphate synthase subunit HisH [Verrucomicrobia bacterium]|nr:imidazole glycerol phosphate synthase subunit HisH [Verrucomicrobiota bacterium]
MIAVVDYGMGNLRSVEKALQRAGGDARIVQTAEGIASAERLVLPGVGAFADCMRNLTAQGLIEPLKRFIESGQPFLGICLGYQVLFERSEEGGDVAGLGILRGCVVRFREAALKVPQIGWNRLRIRKPACPLLRGVADGSHVYFVHSYFPKPAEAALVCAETDYGAPFASMIWKENIVACQFHPEKSQAIGLKMLENFVG